MKKLFTIILLCFSAITFAQKDLLPQDIDKKHELKINNFMLIDEGWIDASYEYLINSESSIGFGLQFGLNNNIIEIVDRYRKFSFTTYYRRYFSNKYARGFFIEGFGMFATNKEAHFQSTNSISLSAGINIGVKLVSKKGFTLDMYTGIGSDLTAPFLNLSKVQQGLGRAGISLGYRF